MCVIVIGVVGDSRKKNASQATKKKAKLLVVRQHKQTTNKSNAIEGEKKEREKQKQKITTKG